ncbi:MAG: UbiA family prenyltransferase [Candidatus Edwardsbacteria bacterium]
MWKKRIITLRISILKIIEGIEGLKLSGRYWVLTLFSIIFIRNLLEGTLEYFRCITLVSKIELSALRFFNHYPLFYLSLFLYILILLHLLTKETIKNLAKILVTFWFIIWVPPILDFLISKGKGFVLDYPQTLRQFLLGLPFLLNPFIKFGGVSPGIRVEIALASICIFFYVIVKTRSAFKSLFAFVGLYLVCTLIGSLPLLFSEVSLSSGLFQKKPNILPFYQVFCSLKIPSEKMFALLYLFVIIPALLFTLYLYNKEKSLCILRHFRILRSLHYGMLTIAGILLGHYLLGNNYPNFFENPYNLISTLAIVLSVVFAFQFAKIINDIFDYKADEISKHITPLTEGKISTIEYQIIGIIFLFLSLYLAVNVSYSAFLLVLFCCAISFLYSVPPLRLKKLPLISVFLIAVISLAVMWVGFSLFAGPDTFLKFPKRITYLVLLTISTSFNAKDLKDIEGDRANGILTIPVILGDKIGRIIIAFLILGAYLCVPLILSIPFLFFPSILLGISSLFITLKKKKTDRVLLFLYLIFYLPLVVLGISKHPDVLRYPP